MKTWQLLTRVSFLESKADFKTTCEAWGSYHQYIATSFISTIAFKKPKENEAFDAALLHYIISWGELE